MSVDLGIEQIQSVESLHSLPVSRPGKEEDCKGIPGASACHHTVQCFICSRIYFDQTLSRCPRCNSDSLQHYTTADLNYLVRDRIRESFGVSAVIQDE
jgi:hypothetical protein